MKKKLFAAFVMVLLIMGGKVCEKKAHEDYLIAKGYKLFGSDVCPRDRYLYEDSDHHMSAGSAFTPYKCEICNKNYSYPCTAIPKICDLCANITGRCMDCGKLENPKFKSELLDENDF